MILLDVNRQQVRILEQLVSTVYRKMSQEKAIEIFGLTPAEHNEMRNIDYAFYMKKDAEYQEPRFCSYCENELDVEE